MAGGNEVRLVYDRECPVCDFYCRRVDLAAGELVRVNAREPGDLMQEITATGYDVDEGMVLKVGDSLYYGSDAIHELALLSSRKGFCNRIMSWIFRYPRAAGVLYPPLVACRNLLLKLLGRSRINNLNKPDNEHF